MVKIVILGSCKHEPYEILAVPNKIPKAWNTEKGYKIAAQKFYPAIKQTDIVIVYAPNGIGEHMKRDIAFAIEQGKPIFVVSPGKRVLAEPLREIVASIKDIGGLMPIHMTRQREQIYLISGYGRWEAYQEIKMEKSKIPVNLDGKLVKLSEIKEEIYDIFGKPLRFKE